MLSVGRCGVARLQMKFGHTDGMHCIIDVTSILVKIKSVALYNCWTVYVQSQINPVHIFPSYLFKILNHGSQLHVESINGPLDTAPEGIRAGDKLLCVL